MGDGAILSEREVNDRIRDHDLVPLMETCFQEAQWNHQDLTHIACTIGPGGFTSLRVGVSLANTLIDQLDISAAGIHLSDLYAARIADDDGQLQDSVWLHSTKKDFLFIRGFGRHRSTWPEPCLISLEEASAQIPKDAFWTGELIPNQEEILRLRPALLHSFREVLPSYLSGLTYQKKALFPWYGR